MENKVINYIESNWHTVIRECREDKGELVGVPYPFTVPAANYFETLYYWDTYFTNVGLLVSDKAMLAKNNTDNMLYLVDKYGFMPNSNGVYHLDHSQPPFLSIMVREIFEYYNDKVWLSGAYPILCREYDYWMTKRTTPIGLNRYDTNITDEATLAGRAADYEMRIRRKLDVERAVVGRHYLATCESGYDCNSRFDVEIFNFAPICLNSLMYAFETNMAYFSDILGKGEAEAWLERAEKRKAIMYKYMVDEDGLFRDYNYVTGKLSHDLSTASCFPLYCGVADEAAAASFVKNGMPRLETEYGMLANAKNDIEGNYQWGYPNGWAPHQYMAVKALERYGYQAEAKRVAAEYIKLIDKTYAETENLWEKYNIIDGSVDVVTENVGKMPVMLGWTAGVYIYLIKYLEK